MRNPAPAVAAANALTRAWSRELPVRESTVISAPGVWVLLAALTAGAAGVAGDELGAVVAVPRVDAGPLAATLVAVMEHSAGLAAAVGMWTRPEVRVMPEFLAAVPAMAIDRIPDDHAELDRWTAEQTRGMITRFPIVIDPGALLVLASALVADAPWTVPFESAAGCWTGTTEHVPWLERTDPDVDSVAVLGEGADRVTRVVCQTASDFEVHLLVGDGAIDLPSVIAAGMAAIGGAGKLRSGGSLAPGESAPGLRVDDEPAFDDTPRARVSLPEFSVAASHDLLGHRVLFGLDAATNRSEGHFPGISTTPLAVDAAVQEIVATFGASGFHAAATSGVSAVAAGVPAARARTVAVTLDRPFAFLVVDRATGLVMFAGWVTPPVG